jgi:valine--pyruvate aminotransferase
MSLSKIGLPATRTGIIIADKKIISLLSSVNAIVSLASGGIGQTITYPLIENGSILKMSNEIVQPFYKEKSIKAINYIKNYFNDKIDYYIHKSEGALFLWIWFKGLPVTSYELYNILKSKNVLIIPGHYFFPGLKEDWDHKNQCIRITYSQNDNDVHEGIKLIANVINDLYK